VVVVLDHKQRLLGKTQDVWTHNGTRNTKRGVVEVALEMEKLGAGEIVLNSIDNDGKMKGYDLALAAHLRELLTVPLTVLGGGGSLDDMHKVVAACGVVGVAAGSFFVFKGPYRAVLISYPTAQQKLDSIYSALQDDR